VVTQTRQSSRAQTIGLSDEIGSPEPGKKADPILVDMTSPNLSPVIDTPVRNIVPNLGLRGKLL
jgi:5-methylthioadenosine/S-adenosylhomocysteine deaminase